MVDVMNNIQQTPLMQILDDEYKKIYDSSTIKRKFLILAYGTYLSGDYVPEGMEYFHMEAHFALDTDVFNGCINVSCCDKIWIIEEDNTFEEIK